MKGSSSEFTHTRSILVIKWVLTFLAVCSILCFPLSGAMQEENPTLWPRSVVDDNHQTVTLPSEPARIVSLAPSHTEILFSLGLADRIVGVTDYCNYPAAALKKDKIGGFSTVSLEKVVALHPDLVVASSGNNQEVVDRIKDLGIPVYFSDPRSLDDIYSTYEKLGYVTGSSQKAHEVISDLKLREETVKKQGEASIKRPTVAHVIWHDPIYVSGNGTFQDELIRIAGGINAFADKNGHAIVSIEEFVSKSPDIIMVNSGSGMGSEKTDILQYFRNEPRLSGIPAIALNRTIQVDSDIADRAGPRLWDLLEEIAPKFK